MQLRDDHVLVIRIKKVQDLINPILNLVEDASLAEKMLKENDTQYLRRCFIRALFAMIEGAIFTLKQAVFTYGMTVEELTPIEKRLSISELVLLQEISIELGNNGKIIHN
jgi:hypothetical protein